MELIYEEKAIKWLICGDFISEICDIIDMKRHYFTAKLAPCPIGGQKGPHTVLKCPPFGIWPLHVDFLEFYSYVNLTYIS